MKQRLTTIVIFAAFLVGVILLLYPAVSNAVNSRHQTQIIRRYDEAASQLTAADFSEYFEKAEKYNDLLFRTEDVFFHPERVGGYEETLDITGTGIMGYLTIEKIHVSLPIYHTVDEKVLQIAAGHLQGTSLPVGGENTHAVLSGHRGMPGAMLFTDLDKMSLGDRFVITVLDRDFTYEVDQVKTILPTKVEDLQIEEGRDFCTLLTCTPYGINSHRLIIRGTRVETERRKASIYIASEAYQIAPVVVTGVVAAPMLLVAFVVMEQWERRRRRREALRRKGLEDYAAE